MNSSIMHAFRLVTRVMTLAFLLSFWFSSASALDMPEESILASGELFLPSENAMADVDRELENARKNGRLTLIVLGANWCHDSRALAKRLYREPLLEIIDKHYSLVFVDVGYYQHGLDVMRRFGSPVYYATPSVLIVDPESGTLVNSDNRNQWGNAYNISMDDTVDYFELMAESADAEDGQLPSAQLVRLKYEIQLWEESQSNRVEEGFAVLGPLLKALKEGQKALMFDAYWKEFSQFRNAIPKNKTELVKEASQRVAAGESDIRLNYPNYPAFSWQN